MNPGIYTDITNAAYHGGEGISKSGLDLIHQSPMHFKHARDTANDNERVPTVEQMIGTAFHALVLEPEVFAAEFAVEPSKACFPDTIDSRDQLVEMVQALNEGRLPKLSLTGGKDELINRICDNSDFLPVDLENNKTSELKYIIDDLNKARAGLFSTTGSMSELAKILRENGKEFVLWADVKAELLKTAEGKTILTGAQFEQVCSMAEAVKAHPVAGKLMRLEAGLIENSVYWVDEATGELCRCRPDKWLPKSRIVIDLKSTTDASPEGFAKSILNWRYHAQAPFYLDGCSEAIRQSGSDIPEPTTFVFVAVEKKPPYAVGVYAIGKASIEVGRAEYLNDLAAYAECKRSGIWPGYCTEVESIELPAWAMRRAVGE